MYTFPVVKNHVGQFAKKYYTFIQNLQHLWHCAVIKLHILEWPFIVASLKHTCAIIMLSNQHLDMPHL